VHIAYLVNHYPKVSHTFIRREIQALERQGLTVHRLGVRGWADNAPDPQDQAEKQRTRYLLQGGLSGLVGAVLAVGLTRPLAFARALALALRLGRRADRPWPLHLVYLAEACVALRLLRETPVQHVHAHFGTNATEVAALLAALGGPGYSFTVHGPEEFDKAEFLHLREKIVGSRFVVAITSFCRSQLFRSLEGRDWPKVKVVHCGLEADFHRIAARAPLGPRLVCVGRLCEQKGHQLLIEAAAQVARAGLPFELVLAGDGELRPAIEAQVAALGLQGRVRITGWISSQQVREELLDARALVLASFAEGLPVVVMEAMALRRPVVTTAIAGIPELVLPGVTGWLAPAGDVDSLAAAITDCLRCPDTQWAQMGEAAHARVLERHDADTEARKLAQHFRAFDRSPAHVHAHANTHA
jgi:colanic acid/amylovoran biosynthesis glycosyltransferase